MLDRLQGRQVLVGVGLAFTILEIISGAGAGNALSPLMAILWVVAGWYGYRDARSGQGFYGNNTLALVIGLCSTLFVAFGYPVGFLIGAYLNNKRGQSITPSPQAEQNNSNVSFDNWDVVEGESRRSSEARQPNQSQTSTDWDAGSFESGPNEP